MINGKAFLYTLLLLVMLLAACRPAQVEQGPFVQATATATPRSTPLPPVPTVVPPGTADNPIQMVINPDGVVTSAQISSFEEALREQSDLVINVSVVERYAEALAALCDSSPTNVTVAWLDGVTLEAALAQNCGEPVMQVERGTRNAQAGDAGLIIASEDAAFSGVEALDGRTFCRLALDDYYSWLVPSLMMRANGVDPVNDLESVVDYDSRNALIEAVINGDCDATGISAQDFEALRDAQQDALASIAETPPLPYAVLLYPLSLPLGERIRLEDALLVMENDTDASAALRPLLGQDSLSVVDDDAFEDVADFLADTGLDFAQLSR
ncbi:MAG: hypothetical protein CL610_19335 [Anaerolineaceae bacterium]|nr:hypothetical protein [Anaerolineaceae bacterium]